MADEPKTAETQSPSTAEPEPAVVAAGEEAAEPARAKQDAASKADPSPGTASLDRDMMRLMVADVLRKQKKSGIERAMPWFTLAIALVGAVLGIYSSLATRDAAKRETAQKIQELLDEAFDLLGGEEGTPFISGSLRIRDPIVLTKVDRLISEALLLDPGSAGAHMRRGDLLDVKGLPEQAITEYRKAIELDPNDALAHYNLVPCIRTN